MSIRFTQSCPTCGRRLQVRASLLGCVVVCQHCKAEFVTEPGAPSNVNTDGIKAVRVDAPTGAPVDTSDELMARVDRMLAQADKTVSG